ncbi:uncharacterized protein B0I36DRAFT_335975 [Microdochium trichocladiopsis]|uniref:Zn(2)-C6 fungal-type domain-containing protein n=1 Tax=Microdochium trichocladiopsis TaxID=1682393 RepID=A0A9P9BN42_9PEZI|nr:uncharacterized protein B0I36DRAFT_335975 [Microdochium trichocladiopsis]KAH7018452.1 hypothetical protein B0I36DRAFT_335975 [Microdochium trichocladiopsis]
MMTPITTSNRLARTSCFSCRGSKRRCDKTLPGCQLCSRRGLRCSYPQRRGQPLPSPESAESATNAPYGQTLHVSQSFALASATRFIAPDLFRAAGLEIPRLDHGVPDEVVFHLGDSQQIRDTTAKFFGLTKSWMPIINRKRHLAAMLNPLSPSRRPAALLSICMKLCLPVLDGEVADRTSLYRLAKRFYSEVEITEKLSVQVLQAAVCIAIFEIGDAIYPAAYLTVGACARYGIIMGLDKVNKDRMGYYPHAVPWIEIEEARRVWWGVLVLDRFLNFASPSRNLATEDPGFDDILPVDDDRFYYTTTQPSDAVPISQAFSLKAGQFSRLCQATYLVSKVLKVIRSSAIPFHDADHTTVPPDIAQLCRTLEALVRANAEEITIRKLGFCSQSVVSYSGVFLLQHHYWARRKMDTTQEAELYTFVETRSAFDTLCHMSSYLQQAGDGQQLLGGECTFFLADVIYQAISTLMNIGRGSPSAEIQDKIATLKWLLQHLKSRWLLAGVYLSILETKEALLTSEAM